MVSSASPTSYTERKNALQKGSRESFPTGMALQYAMEKQKITPSQLARRLDIDEHILLSSLTGNYLQGKYTVARIADITDKKEDFWSRDYVPVTEMQNVTIDMSRDPSAINATIRSDAERHVQINGAAGSAPPIQQPTLIAPPPIESIPMSNPTPPTEVKPPKQAKIVIAKETGLRLANFQFPPRIPPDELEKRVADAMRVPKPVSYGASRPNHNGVRVNNTHQGDSWTMEELRNRAAAAVKKGEIEL